VQGPRTTTHAGAVDLREKLDINPFSGEIHVIGDVGGRTLDKTIRTGADGKSIIDSGTLGELQIDRTEESRGIRRAAEIKNGQA
jgi:hypothetical protein